MIGALATHQFVMSTRRCIWIGLRCTPIGATTKQVPATSTGLFPAQTLKTAIRETLRSKSELIPVNEAAFDRGVMWFSEQYGDKG